jgi:hypothetical protein
MTLVLEVLADVLVRDHLAGRGHVRPLDGQDHVVLERLGASFDEQRVHGQARTADTHTGQGDRVLDRVGDALLAVSLRDRLEVLLEGVHHAGLLPELEAPLARRVLETALAALDHREPVEQLDPRAGART